MKAKEQQIILKTNQISSYNDPSEINIKEKEKILETIHYKKGEALKYKEKSQNLKTWIFSVLSSQGTNNELFQQILKVKF